MSVSNDVKKSPGTRPGIGVINTEPRDSKIRPQGLSPQQQALREATIKKFKANKVRTFLAKQVKYINPNRQVADSIKFLFDEHNRPPANAPMEDIVAERQRIESDIRWFQAMVEELQNSLIKIKEIEGLALDLIENKNGNIGEDEDEK